MGGSYAVGLAVLAGVLAATTACGDDSEPNPGRGYRGATPGATVEDPASPSTGTQPSPVATRPGGRPGAKRPPVVPVTPPPTDVLPTKHDEREEPAPQRDYPAELRRAVGDVTACIPRGTPATARRSFRLQAVVTTNGVVTRAYVTAPGLPAEAAECVRRRVEAARFPAPIPDAPRTITASVEVEPIPQPTKTGEGAPAPP